MRVGPASGRTERTYQILTYVLGALLLAALIAIAWLIRRGARAGGVAQA